jgi:hypothetical protein
VPSLIGGPNQDSQKSVTGPHDKQCRSGSAPLSRFPPHHRAIYRGDNAAMAQSLLGLPDPLLIFNGTEVLSPRSRNQQKKPAGRNDAFLQHHRASNFPPRWSSRFPGPLSRRYLLPRLGARPAEGKRLSGAAPDEAGGDKDSSITSFAALVALPRPLVAFVNATAGPYVPRGRRNADELIVSVIVTPLASVVPKLELAVSQVGVLIE